MERQTIRKAVQKCLQTKGESGSIFGSRWLPGGGRRPAVAETSSRSGTSAPEDLRSCRRHSTIVTHGCLGRRPVRTDGATGWLPGFGEVVSTSTQETSRRDGKEGGIRRPVAACDPAIHAGDTNSAAEAPRFAGLAAERVVSILDGAPSLPTREVLGELRRWTGLSTGIRATELEAALSGVGRPSRASCTTTSGSTATSACEQ